MAGDESLGWKILAGRMLLISNRLTDLVYVYDSATRVVIELKDEYT